MLEQIRHNNVNRFSGFSTLYDRNRPSAPQEIVSIIGMYLQGKPGTVVDVGCGTGLSTFIWLDEAERIIGIEPNDDMRNVAEAKRASLHEASRLSFTAGLSHELGLPAESADVITCSQSFHWMEPESTLREFARVLRPGGVFAAYDCDWPPSIGWQLEASYNKLVHSAESKLSQLAAEETLAFKWDKEGHLGRIQSSGLFRYARELVFHHREACDAERYVRLALSQGGVQAAISHGAAGLDDEAERFREEAETFFGGRTLEMLFGYRMRIGVK